MNKVLVILQKEWLELRQQRLLLLGVILPPVIFTLIPLIVVYTLGQTRSTGNLNMPPNLGSNSLLAGLSPIETVQAALGMQLSVLYVLLPSIITSIVASYSIVGEKTNRTLEPVLATPISTTELLVGKCLASLIPGIGVTWLSGLLFMAGLAAMGISQRVFLAIVSPGWLILFLIWSPLLGMIAVAVMVAISSRVNDPRSAQQASVWIIIPFFAMFFGQAAGVQVLGPLFTLIVAIVLLALALLAIWLTTVLFQREVILTRWK